jgi:hypothetical protein
MKTYTHALILLVLACLGPLSGQRQTPKYPYRISDLAFGPGTYHKCLHCKVRAAKR